MRSWFDCYISLLAACLVAILSTGAPACDAAQPLSAEGGRDLQGIVVLDGSGIHDAGELILHTGNWGIFGSFPGANTPISEFPSAEWPAGSGIEHLYISGLWVGARKGCIDGSTVPCISTAAMEMEFRPTDDPIDRFYQSYEGAAGGNRLPSPFADDDGDGLLDEDWLDGHDNDGDGMIDEDYAAISDQMFSSWFTDYQQAAVDQYPNHNPMHIMVRQESYQWTDPRFDDFAGITFTITNTGMECLREVYLGLFVDADIGRRGSGAYWEDDAAGYWEGIRCTELGPASLSMAYMYNTDPSEPPSYFGAMILGHLVDRTGMAAPPRVGATSFRAFSADQPYENGGAPTNDFQRYEVMAQQRIDRNQDIPYDYHILISTGPFGQLASGQSLVFHVGLVAGYGLEGLLDNAAMCQKLFDGLWYDVDGDPMTGIDRRETPLPGPVSGVAIDRCRPELSDPASWPRGVTRWINDDCEWEDELKEACGYGEADSLLFRTGVAGRETHVNWIYDRPAVPEAALDIRPGSCPNPFNVKLFEFAGSGNPKKGGVLPAAILGGGEFDVRDIAFGSLLLEGVAPRPHGWGYEDVSSPASGAGCECSGSGPDGYADLVLKFSSQEVAAALLAHGEPVVGENRPLILKGELEDGTAFEASDCVRFVGPPPGVDRDGRALLGEPAVRLLGAAPNPFNPLTTIRYELAAPAYVTITVYDVGGRLVRRLTDRRMDAGRYEAVWDGLDGAGSTAASGVYFYRLRTADFVETKKLVLLR